MILLDSTFLSRIRIGVTAFLAFLFFMLILIRLWMIQVMNGEVTRERLSHQYVRNIRVPASRGRILSSDGFVLAGNRPSWDVVFHLSEMRRKGAFSGTVAKIFRQAQHVSKIIGKPLQLTEEDVRGKLLREPGLPLTIFQDLNRDETARALELAPYIPGMEVLCTPVRDYPGGELAGVLIGAVRRQDPGSADDRKVYNYYVPDVVGISGLEKACDLMPEEKKTKAIQKNNADAPPEVRTREALLRGTPGKQLIIVDHRRFVRQVIEPALPAENGRDVILTLNARAQRLAEKHLRGHTGALVLLDADNGAVLAMASLPGYAPARFIPRISRADYHQLLTAEGHPLLNKAVQGVYSPGSIIKPLVGLSALENGLPPERIVHCDGATWFGDHPLNCWIRPITGGGHGDVTLQEALTYSCNDFFVETGLRLGVEKLQETYRSAGIGSRTGFLLPERSGRLPDRSHRKDWNAFDTGLISIGQGDVLLTPLQAALYYAAIANGGTLWHPRILDCALSRDGSVIRTWRSRKNGVLAASEKNLQIIRNGLHHAVHDSDGGSRNANTQALDLFGKTGTAEVGPKNNRHKNTWFAGFGVAPASGRRLAITVLVEHGVSGGKTAAPIAKAFLEELLAEE